MNCEHCQDEFIDSFLGLTEMTFHILIHHTANEINKDESVDWEPTKWDDLYGYGMNNTVRSFMAGRL